MTSRAALMVCPRCGADLADPDCRREMPVLVDPAELDTALKRAHDLDIPRTVILDALASVIVKRTTAAIAEDLGIDPANARSLLIRGIEKTA